MSIEKRDKGKKPYIARVYIGTKNGVAQHRSKSFSRLQDAKSFEYKYRNFKNNAGDRTISDKVLFSEVFLRYVSEAGLTKKDNTIKNYKATFNKWIEPHLGTQQIGSINHLTIIRYFSIIRKDEISEYMANYVHIVLGEIFKFATTSIERYIIEDPMHGLKKPHLDYNPSTSIKFWDKDKVPAILKSIRGHHYYPIVVLLINTGIRDGEAQALTVDSFDFERGVMEINNQLTAYEPKDGEEKLPKATLVINTTKGKEARSINLNKQAMAAAQILIKRAEESENYFLLTPKNKSKKTLVVIKRGSKCKTIEANTLSTQTLGDFIKKMAINSEVEDIGPHGLRHTFAANFLMNGGDLYTLSKILGHKDIKSTQIYAHLTAKFLKGAMKMFGFGE